MTTDAKVLQTLTDTAIDSVHGYEKAAQRAVNPQLKSTLTQQAAKRRATVDKLNAEIRRLGGEPRTDGSTAGAIHRAWVSLADAIGDKDENAAERVEEGEDYICGKFKEAIDQNKLSPDALAVVQEAYMEIREGERITDALEKSYD